MFLPIIPLLLAAINLVDSAKQEVKLSDSYLPVAMQIIAHLTDQMSFEVRDEATSRPTTKPTTNRPYVKPTTSAWWQSTTKPTTNRPSVKPTTSAWWQSTTKPTTNRPPVKPTTSAWWQSTTKPTTNRPTVKPTTSAWWQSTTNRVDQTTPYHRPGLYAPVVPPKPSDRLTKFDQKYVLLPLEQNSQYTILEPQKTKTEEPLLSIQHEEFKPLIEPGPDSAPLLPPHYEVNLSSRSDGYVIDDTSEENLQYLSEDLREMIKMAKNPNDDKLVDIWEGVRQGPQQGSTKVKISSSNLRLLLLYDLLSRDAKRQRLSDYNGFSNDVMKNLVDSSSGGARAQLRMALSKMVERHDCGHDYANNRAREMVTELGKDESVLSSELRYLQPLVYKY